MNILIPLVGRGQRLQSKYNCPKPLVKLKGKSIIEYSVSSLGLSGQYIFIIREYDEYGNDSARYNEELEQTLIKLIPNCKIIKTRTLTQGPACSALLAKSLIDTKEPLVITNCDQITTWDANKFVSFVKEKNCDGCVTTFPFNNIKLGEKSAYSFIKLNSNDVAVEFEEKLAISESALNGIHYWKEGALFVASAEDMIKENNTVNGEFYVSKTFNYLIKQNKKIIEFRMNKNEFFALGNNEEIDYFLNESR